MSCTIPELRTIPRKRDPASRASTTGSVSVHKPRWGAAQLRKALKLQPNPTSIQYIYYTRSQILFSHSRTAFQMMTTFYFAHLE